MSVSSRDIQMLTSTAKSCSSMKSFSVTVADEKSQAVVLSQLKNELRKSPNSTIILLRH